MAKSSFEKYQILNKDLVGVQLKKTVFTFDKPISVGISILELSKCAMYEHHYNYVMEKYGHEKAKLMMINTDSLLYQITTDDLYQDMEEDKHLFDFSNYDKDHPLYDTSNAKRRDSLKMKQGSADPTIRRFAQQHAFNQVWTCGTKEGQRNCEICNQERAKT